MTREEQIEEARKQYQEENHQLGYSRDFVEGAKWADKNSKHRWHLYREERPKENGSYLLIYESLYVKRVIDFADYYQDVDKWTIRDNFGNLSILDNENVIAWFEIPELD